MSIEFLAIEVNGHRVMLGECDGYYCVNCNAATYAQHGQSMGHLAAFASMISFAQQLETKCPQFQKESKA